jgi:hypothetical protein
MRTLLAVHFVCAAALVCHGCSSSNRGAKGPKTDKGTAGPKTDAGKGAGSFPEREIARPIFLAEMQAAYDRDIDQGDRQYRNARLTVLGQFHHYELNREKHNVDILFTLIGTRNASAYFKDLKDFPKIERIGYEQWIAVKGLCRGGSAGGVIFAECSLLATFDNEKECRAWAAKK